MLCVSFSHTIWYKDQDNIQEQERDRYSQNHYFHHHYLIVYEVTKHDMGPYYCVGRDKRGNFFKKNFQLYVGCKFIIGSLLMDLILRFLLEKYKK